MTRENCPWEESQKTVEEVLRRLPEISEAVQDGHLENRYQVAGYDFEDNASLPRLPGRDRVKQTGWRRPRR